MVRLFLVGNPAAVLMIPLLILGYDFLWIHTTPSYAENSFGLIGNFSLSTSFSMVLANALVASNSLLMNRLFNLNSFLEKTTFLPSLIYIISCSFFDLIFTFDAYLIVHFLLLNLLHHLLKLSLNETDKSNLFNAFFLLGCCIVFLPKILFIAPLFLILLSRFMILRIKDYLILLTAFIIPLLYVLTYRFVIYDDVDIFQWFVFSIRFTSENIKLFLIALVLFIVSMVAVFQQIKNSNINLKRKLQSTILFGFILLLNFLLFDSDDNNYEKISFFYIPFSVLLTFTFLHKPFALIATSMFYLVILFSLLKFFII